MAEFLRFWGTVSMPIPFLESRADKRAADFELYENDTQTKAFSSQ